MKHFKTVTGVNKFHEANLWKSVKEIQVLRGKACICSPSNKDKYIATESSKRQVLFSVKIWDFIKSFYIHYITSSLVIKSMFYNIEHTVNSPEFHG